MLAHLQRAREKDLTVEHFKQALATQQEALAKYLQVELEEMVNLAGVAGGVTRVEDVDAWLKENSGRVSRFYDGGPTWISPLVKRGNAGEAAERAELDYERTVREAGLDKPLITLPAFGDTRLRARYRFLFAESERSIEELRRVNEDMGRSKEELGGRLRAIESEKEAMDRLITKSEDAVRRLSRENMALKWNLTESEKRI